MTDLGISNSLADSIKELGTRAEKPEAQVRGMDEGQKRLKASESEVGSRTLNRNLSPNSLKEIEENLEKVYEQAPVSLTNLSFEFVDDSTTPIIKVYDKKNDEVIREIPSEEFREVAKALEELADKLSSKGVLLDINS